MKGKCQMRLPRRTKTLACANIQGWGVKRERGGVRHVRIASDVEVASQDCNLIHSIGGETHQLHLLSWHFESCIGTGHPVGLELIAHVQAVADSALAEHHLIEGGRRRFRRHGPCNRCGGLVEAE